MNSELVKYTNLSQFVSSRRIKHPFLPTGKLFVVENGDGEQGIFSCDTQTLVVPLINGAAEFTPIIVPEHRRFLWKVNFRAPGKINIYDVRTLTSTRYDECERIIVVNSDILLIVCHNSLVLSYLKAENMDDVETVKVVDFKQISPDSRAFIPNSVSIKRVEGGNVLIITYQSNYLICVIDLVNKTGIVMCGENYDGTNMPAKF